MCAGTSQATKDNWIVYTGTSVFMNIDMSECKFVSTPIVTSSLEGKDFSVGFTLGGSVPKYVSKDRFKVYLHGYAQTNADSRSGYPTLTYARNNQWAINWFAIGFTC